MFNGYHKSCIWLAFWLISLHANYAQFGPGGVGDDGEVVLWLHHSMLDSLNASNPLWKDVSGLDNHAVTSPAMVPVILNNRFGNSSGARFNGNQTMTVTNDPSLNFNSDMSLAVVVGNQSLVGDNRFVFSKGAGTTNDLGYSLSARNDQIKLRLADDSKEYYDSLEYPGLNNPAFAISLYDDSDETSTLNTGALPALFVQSDDLDPLVSSQDLVVAGGPLQQSTSNWVGYIGEIVLFNRKLNVAEELILENYLSVTFDINIARPLYVHGSDYAYQLAGIGRVDGSNTQTDAKGDGMVRIDQASDLDDGEYLLWAHNNEKVNSGGVSENVWRVDRTGNIGQVRLRLYLAGYGINDQNDVSLFVSNVPTFNGATEYQATDWDDVTEIMTFENVSLGNNDYFTFQPGVVQAGPPIIDECPLDITTVNDPGVCEASVGWVPPISDGTLTSSHNPGDNFPVGTTTVTYTATNAEGTTTCTFDIIVNDVEMPVLSNCPSDIIINDADDCEERVSWTPPVASDNCNVVLSSSHNPGDLFSGGTTTVTYIAIDDGGNSVSCSFDITLVDDEAPELEDCPKDIMVNAGANCDQVVNWPPPTVTDNCMVTLSSTHNPGDAFPVGSTTVTYTAIDEGGNQSSCSFVVTVLDEVEPQILNCDPVVSITDYQPATADAVATWVVPTFSDNCGIATVTASHNPGDRFPIGPTTVTYKVDDVNGNISECSFQVNVIEVNSAPEVSQLSVSVNAGEMATICLQATDADGDNISLDQVQTTGLMGTIGAVNSQELCFDYTAPEDFEGIETIVVSVCDDGDPQECTNSEIEVNVEIVWELEISQLVTPNGDGINDTWYIGNIDKYPINRVAIFDRWGSSIYSADNYNNNSICWSGNRENDHSRSGSTPSGTFFYQIEISDGRSFKGFIELVVE